MKNSGKIYNVRTLLAPFIFIILMIGMIVFAENSYADVTSIEIGSGLIPEEARLTLSKSNAVLESFSQIIVRTDSKREIYCVKILDPYKNHVFKDIAKIRFENAGKIGDVDVDVILNIDSLVIGKSSNSAGPDDNKGYVSFMWLNSTDASFGRSYEGGYGYKAEKQISATVTVVKHGSDEEINIPCFMAVRDIDLPVSQNVTYYREGWEPLSGFADKYYVYYGHKLNISETFDGRPIFKSKNYMDTTGDDSTYKTGLYAQTSGSKFSFKFYEGDCGTKLGIYSQYKTGNSDPYTDSENNTLLSKPIKNVDDNYIENEVKEGEFIKYTIRQKIGNYFQEVIQPYERLILKDKLPDGVTYHSAAVYNGKGENITPEGVLEYDNNTRTLTFEMGDKWLNNEENYDGQKLKLVIFVKADSINIPAKTVRNSATVSFAENVDLKSNEVISRIYKKYGVKYVYESATADRNLPRAISTETGTFAVSDNSEYITGNVVRRKPEPKEGAVYKTKAGSWSLAWESDSLKVQNEDVIFKGIWKFTENPGYIPSPELKIVKKIKFDRQDFIKEHGNADFIFEIKGKEKSWYASMSFTEKVLNEVLDKGISGPDSAGRTYYMSAGYIYGSCKIELDEGEYDVSEIHSGRFKNVSGSIQKVFVSCNDDSSSNEIVCEFENKKIRFDKFSHTDCIVNTLSAKETDDQGGDI